MTTRAHSHAIVKQGKLHMCNLWLLQTRPDEGQQKQGGEMCSPIGQGGMARQTGSAQRTRHC
eukprot:4823762-Alexandrium_andersonii.AAC.1